MAQPEPPDIRACPVCGGPQEWCDSPVCGAVLPVGHWTHTGPEGDTRANLGDRNRVPGGQPDTPFTRGEREWTR
jgi:hypothetical protein